MKKLIFSLLLSIFSMTVVANESFFYIVGHEDDWELFMNPYPYWNFNKDTTDKIVFIYLTAGDAGLGSNLFPNKSTPYYLAREKGAEEAQAFIGNAEGKGELINARMRGNVRIGNKQVMRVSMHGNKNIAYYLRLPDGNVDGHGFAGTQYQSLQKLLDGSITKIKVINSTQTYTKQELIDTLANIVRSEGAGTPDIFLNVSEKDTTVNIGDHSDHLNTTLLVYQARDQYLPCAHIHKFLAYVTRNYAPNLDEEGLLRKSATWGAMINGLTEKEAPSTFEPGHNQWIPRTYYNGTDVGTGNCYF